MPKISVIIPVYNAEKFLRATLDSVLSQSYTDIEILCVNDGSTDSSKDILMEYAKKDSRVQCHNQENKGVSAARNLGMNKATGEFIFFMDNDDLLAENALAIMLTNIKHADFCVCDVIGVCSRDTNIPAPQDYKMSYHKITPYHFRKAQSDVSVLIWNKLYRLSSIKTLHFPIGIQPEEDVIFTFGLMTRCKSYVKVHANLYGYRLHDGQTMHNKSQFLLPKMQDGALELSRQIKAYLAANKVPFILRNYLLKKASRAIFRSFAAKTDKTSYELQQESLKKLVNLHNRGDFNITDLGIKEMWRLFLIARKNHIALHLFLRRGK